MKYRCTELRNVLIFCIFYFSINIDAIHSSSIKVRTVVPKKVTMSHQPKYPRVKTHSPQKSSFILVSQRKNEQNRKSEPDMIEPSNGVRQDPIQSTFNTGIKSVFMYLRKIASAYVNPGEETESPGNEPGIEESKLRIPGLPTTPIFHQQLNVSSIVKLLESTDESETKILAEAAVVDIVSQLVRIIGFNDLRDWLGIVLMYFILGPILIPLFWLPISLFGMAGLLVPLFFFNPPSKPNTDVMGHDPIFPERETTFGKRSMENFLPNMFKTFAVSKENPPLTPLSSTPGIIESCMERVSCHLTRFYRKNPISQWLTSHFNTTKVEWARLQPEGDFNENGISSWEDCKKYACSVFPNS